MMFVNMVVGKIEIDTVNKDEGFGTTNRVCATKC
jgi:hypothetical protein